MAEEDIPLKDALIDSLTENGILPRLQAQLKAAVFLALEKHKYGERMPPPNQALRTLHSTDKGILMLSIIHDFFESLDLEQSRQVFTHEAELHRVTPLRREEIEDTLNISTIEESSILSQLLTLFLQTRSNIQDIEESRASVSNVPLSSSLCSPQFNGFGDSPLTKSADLKSPYDQPSNHVSPPPTVHNPNPKVEPLPLGDSDPEEDIGQATETVLSQASKSEFLPTGDRPSSQSHHFVSSMDKDYPDEFDSAHSITHQPDTAKLSAPSSPIASNRETTTTNTTHVHQNSARSTTPVIRIYSRHSTRTREQDEASSDIDDSDDDNDIPEVLKDYSIGEDSVDQTIDSNDSLGLDHVEDVKFSEQSSLAL